MEEIIMGKADNINTMHQSFFFGAFQIILVHFENLWCIFCFPPN